MCNCWDVVKAEFCCVGESDDWNRKLACVPRVIGECSSGWPYSDVVDVGETIKTDVKMPFIVLIF